MLDVYVSSKEPEVAVEVAAPVAKMHTSAIEVDELMERLDDDRELLLELTELFKEDYPRQVQMGREALAAGDAGAVRRIGHALKGALSNLGATSAAQLGMSIEAMGKAGELAEAPAALRELEALMGQVVAELQMMGAGQAV